MECSSFYFSSHAKFNVITDHMTLLMIEYPRNLLQLKWKTVNIVKMCKFLFTKIKLQFSKNPWDNLPQKNLFVWFVHGKDTLNYLKFLYDINACYVTRTRFHWWILRTPSRFIINESFSFFWFAYTIGHRRCEIWSLFGYRISLICFSYKLQLYTWCKIFFKRIARALYTFFSNHRMVKKPYQRYISEKIDSLFFGLFLLNVEGWMVFYVEYS